DFRAGIARRAPVENYLRREPAYGIGPIIPPLWAFGTGFIEFSRAVGQREPRVQRHPLAGDDGPGAVVDFAILLVLGEAQVDHRAQEVAGLRLAPADDPRHVARHRIRRARVIFGLVLEEGRDVAERREADAEHVRIL